ncbi:nicotinate-nucleotide adenylyltransferase [Parasynechococcus sp.]|uniref:nicotinate-nucleotide adenylyltransferase n=1 Tax=Parasynechococcus sp. TaxID=3101203 RepID=UPI0037036E45
MKHNAPAVALLGTSADPPSQGHQVLLQSLCANFPRVATWASDNPLKQHAAPLNIRTQLLQALVDEIQRPELSLEQGLSSPWAVTTLERAAARWPDHRLIFVVGSDLAGQIPRWKQADQILQRCTLAIAPREGWPLEAASIETLTALGGHVMPLDLSIPASASSTIRQAPLAEDIPTSVWPLLLKHNLYGLSGSVC